MWIYNNRHEKGLYSQQKFLFMGTLIKINLEYKED